VCTETCPKTVDCMNWRMVFISFSIVVSLVAGLSIFVFSFYQITNMEISTLAEDRALQSREWKWVGKTTRPPIKFLVSYLKEQEGYEQIKWQAIKELDISDATKSNPWIMPLCLIVALMGVISVWIVYCLLYFIIADFTGKIKEKEINTCFGTRNYRGPE